MPPVSDPSTENWIKSGSVDPPRNRYPKPITSVRKNRCRENWIKTDTFQPILCSNSTVQCGKLGYWIQSDQYLDAEEDQAISYGLVDLNRGQYANGNPLVNTDPDGHKVRPIRPGLRTAVKLTMTDWAITKLKKHTTHWGVCNAQCRGRLYGVCDLCKPGVSYFMPFFSDPGRMLLTAKAGVGVAWKKWGLSVKGRTAYYINFRIPVGWAARPYVGRKPFDLTRHFAVVINSKYQIVTMYPGEPKFTGPVHSR